MVFNSFSLYTWEISKEHFFESSASCICINGSVDLWAPFHLHITSLEDADCQSINQDPSISSIMALLSDTMIFDSCICIHRHVHLGRSSETVIGLIYLECSCKLPWIESVSKQDRMCSHSSPLGKGKSYPSSCPSSPTRTCWAFCMLVWFDTCLVSPEIVLFL